MVWKEVVEHICDTRLKLLPEQKPAKLDFLYLHCFLWGGGGRLSILSPRPADETIVTLSQTEKQGQEV